MNTVYVVDELRVGVDEPTSRIDTVIGVFLCFHDGSEALPEFGSDHRGQRRLQ